MWTHYAYHWVGSLIIPREEAYLEKIKNYIVGNLDNQTPKKLCTCVCIPSSQKFGILEFRLLNPFCCNL